MKKIIYILIIPFLLAAFENIAAQEMNHSDVYKRQVIALEELLRKGQVVITRTFRPFEVYMVVALIYLVMTLAISRLVAWSERG